MEEYLEKGGKRLRLGYTTGSCAAAAAKAAAWMLLTGCRRERVSLETPKGIRLELELHDIQMGGDRVRCAVKKDGGDDPDVTTGALVYAEVRRSESPGITVDGGVGVGRVTKPGLDQPVGAAAINSVPRRMIRENLEEVCRTADYPGGLSVVISIPEGVRLAEKTFNPRLGIEGGISVLGTTGIVEPMSEQALVETIRVELRQRRASGGEYVLLTPGNYGTAFIELGLGVDPGLAVMTSNYIGDAVDMCREMGFRGALLVGHIGKLVKLAGGMMNTHSKYGDCRMDILAANGAAAGLSAAGAEAVLSCVACDEAVRVQQGENICGETFARVTERVARHLDRVGGGMETGAVLFSREHGVLGKTENAERLLRSITEG